MASVAELEALLRSASAAADAGDAEAANDARAIADTIVQMRGQPAAQIPGAAPGQVAPPTEAPELTAPGMAGAVTRGLTPALTGATAGGLVAGLPGAAIGSAVTAAAPLVIDPVVEFVNQRLGTNYPTATQALQDLLTRFGVAQPQTFVEKGTEAVSRAVGTGIAAPAGAARAVLAMVPARSTTARVAEAVRVGGMGPTGAGGMTGAGAVGTRTGAAATSGAVGAAAFEPTLESTLTGAALGPVAPAVGAGLKTAGRAIWDTAFGRLLQPKVTAEQALYQVLGGTQETAKGALRAIGEAEAVPGTPGMQRSLFEVLQAGGVEPTVDLAALTKRLQRAGSPVSDQVERFQRGQIGALRTQLVQINDQLRVPMLSPGRIEELEGARAGILARIEADEAILDAAARSGTEARLGTQAPGQAIAVRAEQLADEMRKTLINPAYKEAIDSAGNAPVDITSLIAEAERVLGQPLWKFATSDAPAIARRIQQLAPQVAQVEPTPVGRGLVSQRLMRAAEQPAPAEPATATLEQLHDLRRAINRDIAAAQRGTSTLAGVEVADLRSLHSAVDQAVKQSDTLSDQTKSLYDRATANYRDIYAPRFREGETGRILKPGMFGEMRIEPAQIVGKFMNDADAADQFVRTFAGDPIAFSAMRSGIVEQIREAALDGFTLSPKKLETFLAGKAPILRKYEDAGMNIGASISKLEQEAAASKAAFDTLASEKGPFVNKTPNEVLAYVTSGPARMKLALDRSNAAGQDAIKRVVAEQLNKQLDANPQAVLKTLDDEQTRAAYRVALTPRLVDEFTERAKMGVAAKDALRSKELGDPANYPAVVNRANLSLPQLQGLLKVVQDDVARLREIDTLAVKAGATPRIGAITQEVSEAPVPVLPSASMSTTMNAIVRTFASIEQRVNRKVNAELARIIYSDPEAATVAIQNAIRRAEMAKRPAGVTRAAPALTGATGEATRAAFFPPEPQTQE